MSYMSIIGVAIGIISIPLVSFSNRIIGNERLLPWLMPRRATVYLFNGLLVGLISYLLGYPIEIVLTSIGVATAGYAIYRQPGPDIAFYAAHGRCDYPMPDPKWIRYCLDKFHKIPEETFVSPRFSRNDRIIAGVVAGCYRGLFIVPLAIAQGYLFNIPWYLSLTLGSLGLLFGVIYWFYGIKGPVFRGKESPYLCTLSELTAGIIIVWMNMVYPVILGTIYRLGIN